MCFRGRLGGRCLRCCENRDQAVRVRTLDFVAGCLSRDEARRITHRAVNPPGAFLGWFRCGGNELTDVLGGNGERIGFGLVLCVGWASRGGGRCGVRGSLRSCVLIGSSTAVHRCPTERAMGGVVIEYGLLTGGATGKTHGLFLSSSFQCVRLGTANCSSE